MGRKRKRESPSVTVKFHQDDGQVETEVVNLDFDDVLERGQDHDENEWENTPADGDVLDSVDDSNDGEINTLNNSGGPSRYYRKAAAKQTSWERLREEALGMTVKLHGISRKCKCVVCGAEGECRCKECGSMISFCKECAVQSHTGRNLYHYVEILKNGIFLPLEVKNTLTYSCICDSARRTRRIIVINQKKGFCSPIEVTFCGCLPEFIQLLKFDLWGATPCKPNLAFTIDFLELIHAIQLECHSSLKNICQAFKFYNEPRIVQASSMKEIYPVIIDAFEEYRLYQHKIKSLTFIIDDLDKGNTCPSCPKDHGIVFDSMDALFIGRKKNAGESVGPPAFGELMFCDQKEVDGFVQNYTMPNTNAVKQDCNNFLAGDAVRSLNRYKALSETALYGRACRHEFPKQFVSLKHGERLSYAVWMLQQIEKELSDKPHLQFNIPYDINCMLVKHLQNTGEDEFLNCFDFAIPIFHCYGHERKCQIKYSPRRKEGFGLTDGEALERLWAYIRPFGKITKEMRPSHRTDVLMDALLHYGRKTVKKIGDLLIRRFQKAVALESKSKEDLRDLLDSLREPVEKETALAWENEELNLMDGPFEEEGWSSKYVIYLDLYHALRSKWETGNDANQLTLYFNQMTKVDALLTDIEKDNSLAARWGLSDESYREAKKSFRW